MKYLPLLMMAIGLAGCSKPSAVSNTQPENSVVLEEHYAITTRVVVLKLNDGTRCATTDRGGVDCDWKHEGGAQ
jgi:hypothetical protein